LDYSTAFPHPYRKPLASSARRPVSDHSALRAILVSPELPFVSKEISIGIAAASAIALRDKPDIRAPTRLPTGPKPTLSQSIPRGKRGVIPERL